MSTTFDLDKKFTDLNLPADILQSLNDLGYEHPTMIQSESLPIIVAGNDVVGQAHTGSGKTIAFGIPALMTIDVNNDDTQVLIMCPTRELANQVADEIGKIGKHTNRLKIVPVYGGTSIDRQIKSLKRGAHIVVGTPGRILDHINRRTISLSAIKMVILDEADRMLDMGFVDDMKTILSTSPTDRQTVMFSATMPKPILEIAKRFQKNPINIKTSNAEMSAPKVEQFSLDINESQKLEATLRIFTIENPRLGIIFCNTKRKTDEVVSALQSHGIFADGLHGDMKQAQRDSVLHKFRQGTITVLVATDVAARGLDVDDIDLVINYDFPQDPEQYVHRIGRTGRAGREGKSYAFIGRRDRFQLKIVQRLTKVEPTMMRMPSPKDVEEIQNKRMIEQLVKLAESDDINTYIEKINNWSTIANLDATTLAAILLKMKTVAKSGSADSKKKSSSSSSSSNASFDNTGAEHGMVRFFMNVGRDNRTTPREIVQALVRECGLQGSDIGKINIFDKFTFFEVSDAKSEEVYRTIQKTRVSGISVNVEPANKK
ncbi:MAG: DEAD/DEAH box helicase [Spirochaetota bacterium]|nr:DEAD/DEAH box helicase [Spirochaetota bacterium]